MCDTEITQFCSINAQEYLIKNAKNIIDAAPNEPHMAPWDLTDSQAKITTSTKAS